MLAKTDIRPIANEPTTGTMRQHLLEALGRVSPHEINIATAYLTPNGFVELQHGMERAQHVRLLLGERPFLNRRGPDDILSGPDEMDGLNRPTDSIDWHTFLEGGYPWMLLNHDERRQLLNRGVDPSTTAFNLSAWDGVMALTSFLTREGVEIRRFLGSEVGLILPEEVLDHRSPRNRLHAKAYLFTGDSESYSAVGSSNLASLYETFPAAEARRIAKRLEFHHTPKHGSWLNMAEIEFSVLARACLRGRNGDEDPKRPLRKFGVEPSIL